MRSEKSSEATGTELRVGEGRKNDLATLDAAIGLLRKAIARRSAAPDGGNWAEELAAATRSLNSTPRDRLGGEAPEDVEGNMSLRFDLQKQAGRDAETQDSLTRKRRERLEEAGAFRVPIQSKLKDLPRRGFKPTYQAGPPRKLARLDGDEVVDDQGRRSRVKEVQAVPADSTAVRDPPEPRGDARVIANRRAATTPLANTVYAMLEQPRTIGQITAALTPEQKRLLREQRFRGGTRAFLQLHADRFVVQGQRVTRVPNRARLRALQ